MRCNLILASCTLQEYSVVVNLAILCREKPAGVGTERRQWGVWCCRSDVPCLISSVAAPDSSRSEVMKDTWTCGLCLCQCWVALNGSQVRRRICAASQDSCWGKLLCSRDHGNVTESK
ncbi:hypothetical protein O3P69_019093 [Scylla paramamosain]|uniref:Uncharacterized protein n=1 Tax=Scylla paramamosain TaxID=85552 RepID=A0AAW0SAD8_SCYPA